VQNIQGIDCLKVVNTQGTPWAYFRLPPAAPAPGTAVFIEIRILCSVHAEIWIEYDSLDQSVRTVPDLPGAFKPSQRQHVSATGQFSNFTFTVPDPCFSRRINGADFRIVMTQQAGLPMFIAYINISLDFADHAFTYAHREERNDHWTRSESNISFGVPACPECSIIIPVYNSLDFTLQCLRYLQANTTGEFEVIIVDDGSNVSTRTTLSEIEGVQIVHQKSNLGFARACNQGAKHARGEFLIFLNNDTVPMRGWLSAMLASARHSKNTGVVGSKLVYPGSGKIQHAGVGFNHRNQPYHMYQFCPRDIADAAVERKVDAVTGACLLTRSALFHAHGGFDEQFRNGYEDIDYCMRVRTNGADVVYCPHSELLHYESVSAGRMDSDQEAKNWFRFQGRWTDVLNGRRDKQSIRKRDNLHAA